MTFVDLMESYLARRSTKKFRVFRDRWRFWVFPLIEYFRDYIKEI
jgi:hypothetical protein